MQFCGKVKTTKRERRATLELRCVRAKDHRGGCEFVWHLVSGSFTVDTGEL